MALKDFVVKNGLVCNNLAVNSIALTMGAEIIVSAMSKDIFIGNSTVNALSNSSILKIASATSTANLKPDSITIGASVLNTSAVAIGANLIANSSAIFFGNSTVNAVANSSILKLANSTATGNITPNSVTFGTTSMTSIGLSTTGSVINTTTIAVGANVFMNATAHAVGNSTVNVSMTQTQITIANSTASANVTIAGLAVGTALVNTSAMFVGNSTANAVQGATIIQIANSTSTANMTPIGFGVGTSVVNSTVIAAGANVYANVTTIFVGNSTQNVAISTGGVLNINGQTNLPSWAAITTASKVNTSDFTWSNLGGKPTTVSTWTNDSGYITSASLTWSNISGKPTTVSTWTNDSGYITSSALSPYLLKAGGTMTGDLYSTAVNKSVTSYGPVIIQNASGTGDSNTAVLSFLCNGQYARNLHLRADGYMGMSSVGSSSWTWYSDPSGNMVAAGNVTAYSDPKLKERFEKLNNALDIISRLNGGTFYWKHGIPHIANKAGKRDYGILANEVEAVMPEIVSDSISLEGEVYKTVSYEKLVPVLIEAIKELKAEIDILKGGKG